mgnify:CR=1 FL=1
MALSPRLLGDGEGVVAHMRTHVKALVAPVLALVVIAALAGVAGWFVPVDWRGYGWPALAVAAAVAVVAFVAVPTLRWATTTYTVTDHRIITRRGIITRVGHDLPITRINDVSYRRGLLDRLLGCGTLVLTTAAEDPVYLRDIPDVEAVHVLVANLLFDEGHPDPRIQP